MACLSPVLVLLLLLRFLLQSTFYLTRLPLTHHDLLCVYVLQSREVVAYNSQYFKRLPLKLLLLEMIDLKTAFLCMNMSNNDKLQPVSTQNSMEVLDSNFTRLVWGWCVCVPVCVCTNSFICFSSMVGFNRWYICNFKSYIKDII